MLFLVVRLFPIGGGGARGGSRRRGRGQHLHRLQATARGRSCRYAGQLFFLWSTFYNYILEKLVFKLLIYSVLQRNDLFALMGYLSIFILYNVRFPIATILQGIKLVATPCNVCALFHRWTATFQRHKKEPSSYGIVQWVFRMWFCF